MSKQKRSTNSGTKASNLQEPDPPAPSQDGIIEALQRGESLEMVDWTPEEVAKMKASYQVNGGQKESRG